MIHCSLTLTFQNELFGKNIFKMLSYSQYFPLWIIPLWQTDQHVLIITFLRQIYLSSLNNIMYIFIISTTEDSLPLGSEHSLFYSTGQVLFWTHFHLIVLNNGRCHRLTHSFIQLVFHTNHMPMFIMSAPPVDAPPSDIGWSNLGISSSRISLFWPACKAPWEARSLGQLVSSMGIYCSSERWVQQL